MNPIRVLVLDGQDYSRLVTRSVIDSALGMVLVGEASNAFELKKLIRNLQPDILTLSQKNQLSGYIEKVYNAAQIPTVIAPRLLFDSYWHSTAMHRTAYSKYSRELVQSIKNAVSEVPVKKMSDIRPVKKYEFKSVNSLLKRPTRSSGRESIIVIGAPSGDLDALKSVLLGLQPLNAGILIALQIPLTFERHYFEVLRGLSELPILMATQGQPILPGQILMAPSDKNIEVIAASDGYRCHFSSKSLDSARRPSLDLLFSSLAENAGDMGIAILLLGTGMDGSMGLSRLRQVGANVLLQENDSSYDVAVSVAAIMNGDSELMVPLNGIAAKIADILA